MLAHHGFVTPGPRTATYRAGPALLDVGLAAVRQLDVRGVCRPLLESLAAETGETVHCGVLDGATIRYVDAVESTRVLRVAGRTGMVLPAHCSAAGKALLARLDPEQLRTALPRATGWRPLTARSIGTFAEPSPGCSAASARTGYAVNRQRERGRRRRGRRRRRRRGWAPRSQRSAAPRRVAADGRAPVSPRSGALMTTTGGPP